jgi:hypothetical protein
MPLFTGISKVDMMMEEGTDATVARIAFPSGCYGEFGRPM